MSSNSVKYDNSIFSQNSLQCRLLSYDITCRVAMTHDVYSSDYELTKDTPYLTLTRELWGVSCEYFGENYHVIKKFVVQQIS